jgi:hypothetical protein
VQSARHGGARVGWDCAARNAGATRRGGEFAVGRCDLGKRTDVTVRGWNNYVRSESKPNWRAEFKF